MHVNISTLKREQERYVMLERASLPESVILGVAAIILKDIKKNGERKEKKTIIKN